jgi:class 3 adenylate cyclase
MTETRKLAAILVADIVGYSRLAGADEDRILARLRTLRSDLIDPILAVHHGRVVKRIGDGAIVEFRSVVDAVRCAIEVQSGLAERNAGLPPEKRIDYRVGIHLGDVVAESDGDLMGDGVNIAARLEGIAKPGAICLSEQAYWQVKGRLDLAVADLGATQLKNIAEPIHVYSLEVGQPARAKPSPPASADQPAPPRLSLVVLPFANIGSDPEQRYFVDGVIESLTTDLSQMSGMRVIGRNTSPADRTRTQRALRARRQRPAFGQSHASERPVDRRRERQSSLGRAVRQTRRGPFRYARRNCRPPRERPQRSTHHCRGAARRTHSESGLDGPLFSRNERVQQRAHPRQSLRGPEAVRSRSGARSEQRRCDCRRGSRTACSPVRT